MQIVLISLQLIIALGILNVWLLRFSKPSPWRGGQSRDMKEEFAVYGLSPQVMYLVGFLKIVLALLLIAAIWLPALVLSASVGLAILMAAAVAMHFKAGDPAKKSIPAGTVLLLCLLMLILA
jgi:hypothetical protein